MGKHVRIRVIERRISVFNDGQGDVQSDQGMSQMNATKAWHKIRDQGMAQVICELVGVFATFPQRGNTVDGQGVIVVSSEFSFATFPWGGIEKRPRYGASE